MISLIYLNKIYHYHAFSQSTLSQLLLYKVKIFVFYFNTILKQIVLESGRQLLRFLEKPTKLDQNKYFNFTCLGRREDT